MEKTKELDERSVGVRENIRGFIYSINLFKFALFLVFLKAIDVLSTYYALSNVQGSSELNPVINWAFSYIGIGPSLSLVFIIYSIIIYRIYNASNVNSKWSSLINIDKYKIYSFISILMIFTNLNNIIKIVLGS